MFTKSDATVKIILDLIEEVKQENKGKLITEGLVTPETADSVERKALKQYVTRNVIEALKSAENEP
jgi:hypothetical protein